MFEERSPYSSIRCFRCRFNGTLGTTPHLHDKVHDTLVCVSCGSVMEEEREVLSGVISSWFDATWSEDLQAHSQWKNLGVNISQGDGGAADAVREAIKNNIGYPSGDAVLVSPFQPGLLAGSDVASLERLTNRLQQEVLAETGFLPFPHPHSEEMHDQLAKQFFEGLALFHGNIWDMSTEAILFKSKPGMPLRAYTMAEDLEEVFTPRRPFTEVEHPGLGVTTSVELSHAFKDNDAVIPYAIYNQNPSEEIPGQRKQQMLGELALQALYHDADEGCLVLFSAPEGNKDSPVFAALTIRGLRSYLLEITEQWFDSVPDLQTQLSRFALRTSSTPLHSEWQEEYL